MSVVITGGTGSLGKRLIKHFSDAGERVIVISRDEQKQFLLKEQYPQVMFLLGDVRSRDDLRIAFRERTDPPVDLVIHTAALKHVHLGEYNPYQAVQTNILGAKNVIDVCCEFKVPTCVFVSTDKAVEPVNLYGMTKAVAERLFIQANANNLTKFVGVRYGNVVNSNGSLIPFFQRCVERKEPLLLTDPTMTRFFITLDQAISVIDWARSNQNPRGTIIVPKLNSAYIKDIAELYSEKHNLPIKEIGVRPGEKIHEILLSKTELSRVEDHTSFYRIFDATMMYKFNKSKRVNISSYSSIDSLISKAEIKTFLEGEGLL